MVFIAPKLSAEQALVITAALWLAARGKQKRFARAMHFLIANHCYRLRGPSPRIGFSNHFDPTLDDATARTRFNFTVPQLRTQVVKLCLPTPCIVTPERDSFPTLEALAMMCRRLTELSTIFTVANEFGRSTAAYSRICKQTVHLMYAQHKEILYFNRSVATARVKNNCHVIWAKGAPLKGCWAFIDGTKHYVSRPSARERPASAFENLQRSLYNGHPRRHCFNWQGVTTPDGIIISMYGPVEGRRHDSAMFSMSCLLDDLANSDGCFDGKVIYGDPAYGCSDFVCCPFANTGGSPAKAVFNTRMSKVRESVEWGFGRVKMHRSFLNWDKRTTQSPNSRGEAVSSCCAVNERAHLLANGRKPDLNVLQLDATNAR